MTLKKSPGASNIDLENVTVQWVGPSGTYNLVNATVDASGADGHFGIVPFRDDDDSHPVLNDPDDLRTADRPRDGVGVQRSPAPATELKPSRTDR